MDSTAARSGGVNLHVNWRTDPSRLATEHFPNLRELLREATVTWIPKPNENERAECLLHIGGPKRTVIKEDYTQQKMVLTAVAKTVDSESYCYVAHEIKANDGKPLFVLERLLTVGKALYTSDRAAEKEILELHARSVVFETDRFTQMQPVTAHMLREPARHAKWMWTEMTLPYEIMGLRFTPKNATARSDDILWYPNVEKQEYMTRDEQCISEAQLWEFTKPV